MKQWLEGRGSVICPAPQGQQDGRVDDELDEPCQDDAMKGDVAEDSGAMHEITPDSAHEAWEHHQKWRDAAAQLEMQAQLDAQYEEARRENEISRK